MNPFLVIIYRYTWAGDEFDGVEEESQEPKAASFGIGAAINCNFALNNVEHGEATMASGGVTYSLSSPMGSHPGAGAMTSFHGPQGIAQQSISRG